MKILYDDIIRDVVPSGIMHFNINTSVDIWCTDIELDYDVIIFLFDDEVVGRLEHDGDVEYRIVGDNIYLDLV